MGKGSEALTAGKADEATYEGGKGARKKIEIQRTKEGLKKKKREILQKPSLRNNQGIGVGRRKTKVGSIAGFA